MIFSSAQLRKEARPLLLPWIVIMLAGFLTLVRFPRAASSWSWQPTDLLDWILPLGSFLAIPLLAAMPLGTEFQCGTFTVLLAQPIDRQKLWLQKIVLAAAAVLPAASLYLLSLRRNHEFDGDFWLATVWMVAATAGAVAGTLLARSAIGGLALSSAFFGTLFVFWSKLAESNRGIGHLSTAFSSMTAVVLFFYALTLVWFGRRMFLHFQPVDGTHGANDFLGDSQFLPRIVIDWLRCKPRGAFLNLLRREFHLLRTVWLLTLVSFLTWIFLILFHLVRPNTREFDRAPLPAGLAVILSLLIALLAGSLSLGEEKNWGTHTWQLTMPVSPSAQWVVKLTFALCASVLCAVAIPLGVLIVRGWISGSPYSFLDHTPLWVWLVEALTATSLTFWCSCVAKGTVRAVVSFFPLLFALGLSAEFGMWIAGELSSKLEPIMDRVLLKLDPFHMSPISGTILTALDRRQDSLAIFVVLVAPLMAVLLIQMHRLFRNQTESKSLHWLRPSLLPIAVLASSVFVLNVVLSLVGYARGEQTRIVREIHLAIETLSAPSADANTVQLQKFTFEELAKNAQFSNTTKVALRGATVIVRPDDGRSHLSHGSYGTEAPIQWPFESEFVAPGRQEERAVSYSALIHTSRGSECNLRFRAGGIDHDGLLLEACQ